LEHYVVWFRDVDTKKIGVEVFRELQVVLEENGDDKMARESN
jgi:hypothetical protein